MNIRLNEFDPVAPGRPIPLSAMPPHKKIRGRLLAGTTATGQQLTIPYLALRGERSGPVLWVNGAVHGDEVNGVLAAIEFFSALPEDEVSGAIVVTPVANVLAADQRRKTSISDQLDMDQSFPGNSEGLTTQKLAARLFEFVAPVAEVIVNLHTLGTPFDSRPYAVYKLRPEGGVGEKSLLDLIACFSPHLVCRMPITGSTGELPGNIAGALDYQGLVSGKRAFMIELGAGGRQEPDYIAAGVLGLTNLCRKLGILSGQPQPNGQALNLVTSRRHVMALEGGFFRPHVVPGDILRAGERLGVIHDVFGDEVERVSFNSDVIIIGVRRDPVVHMGDRVGFVGLAWETVDVAQ